MKTNLIPAVICVLITTLVVGLINMKTEINRLKQELSYFNSIYMQKQGYSEGFGNYDLRSLDGGKNWFAVERRENDELILLGPAETIWPGLLAHLNGWDRLLDHVQKHGPVSLTSADLETEIHLLRQAGFTITAK